ncbi:MAG: 2,3-bisphosphoglycerate-independent phosphoglycerate mutase [Candidatus Midichloriaceae bacterium]|jgi:2,3-bisphosphoglycerate-independent phosphoglycerate mutase
MKKLILCILDGWGYSPDAEYNAIYHANTSFLDKLKVNSLIKTSGVDVGLPEGQMGNSEVGHMTIGAGRVVLQDLVSLNQMFGDHKNLEINPTIKDLVKRSTNKICHILGLVSDGGVHSNIEHIISMCNFLKFHNIKPILHFFADGRDVAPKSVRVFIKRCLDEKIDIGSISGRYYAMDRDKRWERTKLAYDAILGENDVVFEDINEYINLQYEKNKTDEFIIPARNKNYKGINKDDTLFFINFRSDRIIQLAEALVDINFSKFQTKNLDTSFLASLTKYSDVLTDRIEIMFHREKIKNDLGTVISQNNLKQLRVAETEKYPHVTYFFNSGREGVLPGEDRILIPSPNVKTYDMKPEMSAIELTDEVVQNISYNKYQFICVNYANADMVGHTGDFDATIKACSAIDKQLFKISQYCDKYNYDMLITADHGNAEKMKESFGQELINKTSHTLNDVPLFYYGDKNIKLKNGSLADIAPTVLDILDIKKPKEMLGKTLVY